jgi:hypothetical protein
MSVIIFKALIGGVHCDPKKGLVKIQLEATSYVSLDKLTSLGPTDASITVTLESGPTMIEEDPIPLSEEEMEKREEAER